MGTPTLVTSKVPPFLDEKEAHGEADINNRLAVAHYSLRNLGAQQGHHEGNFAT